MIIEWIMNQKRLLIVMTLFLTFMGIASLFLVPKNEDPVLPNWFSTLTIVLPGGSAQQIDEQISKKLNDRFKEVEELKIVETTVRPEVVVMQLEMKDSIRETDVVWDKVRNIIDEEKSDFPKGTLEPDFFTSTNDIQTILLAVHGKAELKDLYLYAKSLKEELLNVSGTSKVVLHGDPSFEVQVILDSAKLKEKSLIKGQIAQAIAQANQGLPGGSIDVGGRRIQIQPNSKFESTPDIQQVYLPQGSGDPISLSQISQVTYAPRQTESLTRYNGDRAIYLGLVAQNPIEIVKYGQRVRAKIAEIKNGGALPANIQLQEVSFNPDRTEERLKDLGMNLIIGVLTVGLILWAWMGWRIALVVSSFVPIISIVGFNIFSLSGGVLHQISLAAFVISLGQFIDNIIVIVESMQKKINLGLSPFESSREVMKEFSKPMFFATGTNIAAFIPMLLSSGATAEFTYSIPQVAIITLICAWILALFVVPLISSYLLKRTAEQGSEHFVPGLIVGQFVAKRTILVLFLGFAILATTATGFIWVRKQFFPSADRNQFLVSVELMDGSSIERTDQSVTKIEQVLLTHPNVQSVASFIGSEVPRFYYNIGFPDWGKNRAKLLITTKDKKFNLSVQKQIEEFSSTELLEAKVSIENLEQGPPILAPIEYRIVSSDPRYLQEIANELQQKISNLPSIKNVKTDMGQGILFAKAELDQGLGSRFGIDASVYALDILTNTRGSEVGKMHLNGDLVDIKLKDQKPEKVLSDIERLKNSVVSQSNYRHVTIGDLSSMGIGFQPASIYRYNGERVVRVLAWPKPGYDASESVVAVSQLLIANPSWNNHARVVQGGEAEGSSEANMAIMTTVPIGIFILVLCLLLEFNSIRKVVIILLSVPFVIAGVTPGLLIGNAAFGFMSLLGVLALVGIVVNNSILLIESIDDQLLQTGNLDEAIKNALESRVRPILMTALTTIAGLLPMAFEDSTLWPPLALAMISGLFGSTLITIFFVPALYKIFFSRSIRLSSKPVMASSILSVISLLLIAPQTRADVINLKEVLKAVESSAKVKSAEYDDQSVQLQNEAHKRGTYYPKLGLELTQSERLSQLTQTNPFGTFDYGKNRQTVGAVELTLPIFDPTKMLGERDSVSKLAESSAAQKNWTINLAKSEVLESLITLAILKRSFESLQRIEKKLLEIQKNAQRFSLIGNAGQSDLLIINMAISSNRVEQVKVHSQQQTVLKYLQSFVPNFNLSMANQKLLFEVKEYLQNLQQNQDQGSVLRMDLQALQFGVQSQESKLKSVKSGYLPTVELKGRYLLADQGLLDQKDWSEVGVTLRWALFEGGTRQSLVSAESAKALALRHQLENSNLQIEVERTELRQNIETHLEEARQARSNLMVAEKAALQDKTNAVQGKIQLRDWLESEVRLEQLRLNIDVIDLQLQQNQMRLIRSNGGIF